MSAVMVSMAVLICTFSSGIHTYPVSWNCAYHLRIELSDCSCFPNLMRNCRWSIVPRQSFWITLYICWQRKQQQGKHWECAYVRYWYVVFSAALTFTTWCFRFNLSVSGTFSIPLGPLAFSVISDWLCIDYLSRLLQIHFGETLLPKWVRIMMSLNFLSINARGGYSQCYVPQFSWYLSVIGDSTLISESSCFFSTAFFSVTDNIQFPIFNSSALITTTNILYFLLRIFSL